jgi:transcriptional regulator with XRE-family HTH domain
MVETFGDYLKEQREDRKISLREIALLTNITERYLDFIEKDDFAKIPEGPYIRGYISSYATAIGINAHEALDRFDSLCRERNKAKDIQHEISEDKIRQKSIVFSLNKGKWLLLSSTILVILTFGVYHLFSQNEKKALVVANLQGPEGKGFQTTLTIKSKDNVQLLTMNGYSMSSNKPEGLQNDVEHRGSERVHDVLSLEREPNPQAKKPQRSAGLPSLPSKQPGEASKQTSNVQVVDAHPLNASKVGTPSVTTLPRLKKHSSEQIVLKKKLDVQRRKIPKPTRPILGVTPGERTGEVRSDHGKNIEVLKAAVCTDVKDKKPSGKNNSFQWSTDRVYIWNLIKCESHLSSIRHIYYFKGQKVSDIVLDIKSPLWRTWSYKALLDKRFIGPWKVDITSADGKLLQRVHFNVS